MSQYSNTTPVQRRGGDINVFTGLSFIAFLVLLVGVILIALNNVKHSAVDGQGGGPVKLIQ